MMIQKLWSKMKSWHQLKPERKELRKELNINILTKTEHKFVAKYCYTESESFLFVHQIWRSHLCGILFHTWNKHNNQVNNILISLWEISWPHFWPRWDTWAWGQMKVLLLILRSDISCCTIWTHWKSILLMIIWYKCYYWHQSNQNILKTLWTRTL